MTDLPELLAKQAAWQKERRAMTWPEKIRLALRIRSDAEKLRAGRPVSGRDDSSRPSVEKSPSAGGAPAGEAPPPRGPGES